jgi:hypothetical protein
MSEQLHFDVVPCSEELPPPDAYRKHLVFVRYCGFYWASYALNTYTGEYEWFTTQKEVIGRGAAYERLWPESWLRQINQPVED